ncbi:MAG: beta-propeller domain-containing protein [Candidatus Bathyarchaeota archaeon]|nr:MAG: beta-propeller domain-containing protein [Candidatus Bathyarchaeota archaeon]
MRFFSSIANLTLNKKKIVGSGLIAFIGGALIGIMLLNLGQLSFFSSVSAQPLWKFSSYEELVDFVNTSSSYLPYYLEGDVVFAFGTALRTQDTSTPDYSTTNIQVKGVDEADIVKSDGQYLYVVSNKTVYIINASVPETLTIVSQIRLNGTLHGIFINEDRLVIFGSSSHELVGDFYRSYYWPYATPKTFIEIYDISEKTSPTLTRNVTVDGYYFNSRMIGNYAYVVVNEPALLNDTEVKLPIITHGGVAVEVNATDIQYAKVIDYYGYTFTTIIAIDIQNDAEEPTFETILVGATRSMYVSQNNIFVTLSGEPNVFGVETTLIYRIRVEANVIETAASGEVPGRVLNQFSMDEYDNHFRIATTTGSLWDGKSRNHVYILNMDLELVGKLEGLAPGERIYSARFMGEKFYLVTFRKVDPLFVIELTDPTNPIVLGELKVTGYSDYLHPYDANHVIGVGKETVAAEMGDFSWYQGVKISLFNVSNPLDPQEIDKDEIGDRGTDSPVLRDHKAFLFDKEKQLLVIPVLVAEIDESKYPEGEPPSNAHGDYVWQGAYIYNITLEGLVLKGRVTHIGDGASLQSSYYSYSPYSVKRALYIGDVLYTISDKMVKTNSLDSLDEIGQLELP